MEKTLSCLELQAEQDDEATAQQCCVVLEEVGTKKIQVIKTVSEVTGLSLLKAKTIVDAVELEPQTIVSRVSANRAEEICSVLRSLGAHAIVISKSDDTGGAKAQQSADRRQSAAEKKKPTKESLRGAVLELFRDKVMTEFQGVKAYLENELTWFEVMLGDSGVDTEVMPEVGMAVYSDSEEIVFSVVIGLSD